VSRLSRQCGILNISQSYTAPRHVTGIALLFFTLLCGYETWWGTMRIEISKNILWWGRENISTWEMTENRNGEKCKNAQPKKSCIFICYCCHQLLSNEMYGALGRGGQKNSRYSRFQSNELIVREFVWRHWMTQVDAANHRTATRDPALLPLSGGLRPCSGTGPLVTLKSKLVVFSLLYSRTPRCNFSTPKVVGI
jgi:hypothetical protein